MNQSKQTDIQQVRRALERFYDGISSDADNALLESYFLGTDEADPEPDLAADAKVFKALAGSRKSLTDIEVPDDLEGRILAATCGTSPVVSRRRIFASLGTAAAVALLLGLGIALNTHREPVDTLTPAKENSLLATSPQPDSDLTAPHLLATATTATHLVKQSAITPPQAKSSASDAVPSARKRVKRPVPIPIPAQPVPEEEEADDNYIEIIDPIQAVNITQDVFMLLASNLSTATDALETTDASISSVNIRIAAVIDEKQFD